MSDLRPYTKGTLVREEMDLEEELELDEEAEVIEDVESVLTAVDDVTDDFSAETTTTACRGAVVGADDVDDGDGDDDD